MVHLGNKTIKTETFVSNFLSSGKLSLVTFHPNLQNAL